MVRNASNEILDSLRAQKEELHASPEKIYDFVQAHVLPHFDFERMSRLVLGKHWRNASADERRRFVDEFRQLLVRTYASAMLDYSEDPIVFLPFRDDAEATDVTVRTEVDPPAGNPIPIDYSVYFIDGAWKVYDVSIDGVSLVVNYRSSFANEIRSEGGISGLIVKLQERNQQASVPQP
jgi:phospholipid transport system substrate-binding protein